MGMNTKKRPGLPSAVKYPGMWRKMDTNSCFPQPMGTQTLRLMSHHCPACCVHRVPRVPWPLPAPTPLPGSCLQTQFLLTLLLPVGQVLSSKSKRTSGLREEVGVLQVSSPQAVSFYLMLADYTVGNTKLNYAFLK